MRPAIFGPYKSMVLIHRALLIGQVMFFGVILFIVSTDLFEPPLKALDKNLQVTEIVVAGVCVFLGSRIFASRIEKIREQNSTAVEKMNAYKTAAIVQWALTELPAIFAIVFFMLTGNYAFVALAGALILYFAIALRPIKLKAAIQLRITEEEVMVQAS
ncbi:MAG: hypothetical protein H7Y27_06730 [Gemmatimonadaceae bacterium]|nr:hypothetical protein [Chitinophagaceae bacterium]